MEEFISTYTGKKFHPLSPRSSEIDIRDIGWGLSNKCRFNGQCKQFYSVGQHSLILTSLVPMWYKLDALLHDAGEAYLPDIPVKIKPRFPLLVEMEDEIMKLVSEKYRVNYPFPEVIREKDKELGQHEYLQIVNYDVQFVEEMNCRDLGFSIPMRSPEGIYRDFMKMFRFLTEEVNRWK